MKRLGIGSIEPDEAMDVLDTLLNGPIDQLAFVKINQPEVVR